ncbi:amino acid adenylation domain-containing protein [Granulicella aggregans]|uniref:Amino acid adenylation domain-containing protein n=1 Tax=Granulicella aggregans TaxID=474949 RepID=A0A7W7ZAS2_9BACT|nr:amino acid adenylation domain-containing protein [Granulicella aggregans]MBB5056307.1 amino acid adenylation domain-containing protein [Granulicella aggregans]
MSGSWAKPVDDISFPASREKEGTSRATTGIDAVSSTLASGSSLADCFEQICRKFPDRTAITCGRETISYGDLNQRANRIAQGLLAAHGRTEVNDSPQIVAIYLDRSIAQISSMLGVVKAGFAYLPIDSTYPSARIAQTLEDAAPLAVITDGRLAAGLPSISGVVLIHDQLGISETALDPEQRSTADSLAYVMYTSGSTGKPKGVLVTHGNVMRLFAQTDPWFHFNEHDVWTMFHSFAFDFSVWEIWGPLLTGGRLVIVPFEVSRSSEEFYALLSEERVTVLNQTPSAFSLIDQVEEAGPVLPLALRYVIFGGEALQYRALRNWFKRHGDQQPQLINMYGITETTVHVTYRVVTETDAHAETDSPIGEPIPDLQLYVLDADLKPVTEGEEGELCIGGAGVARGYLNRPELTAQRFIADPFGEAGSLLYRSGDLARRRADGQLIYLGRNDNQVKINGFRIELGEVEAAIAEYPGVRQVFVTAHADHTGRQRLAAYFVTESGTKLESHTLREFLTPRSPAQMMPAFYIQMESFPLTNNGKVDRKALPTPTTGSAAPAAEAGTPMQERVAAIWREVLEAPNVGLDDNFFDIGGSSILLIRIRAELQKQLDRQIPITWMFEFTSIRILADKLREEPESVAPSSAVGSVLSAAQEQARKQREAFARMRAAKGVKA